MMFKGLQLKEVYDTSVDHISKDLIIPLLENAVDYRRGVGYFTSNWLALNLEGLLTFVENNGKATIITSPQLEQPDIDAIYYGEIAKKSATLHEILIREVEQMKEKLHYDHKVLLAWLIADELLSIQIAVPKNSLGMFHDKYAIFTDVQGDKVVLHGSLNDSYNAYMQNGEGISVFKSWEPGLQPYIEFHEQKFQQLFAGENDFYQVFDIPKSIKAELIALKAQTAKRPYKHLLYEEEGPAVPKKYDLFEYQREAIDAWYANNKKGFLSMATGTGKTVTALAASVEQYKEKKRIVNVISVPFQHLVEQWAEDAQKFGYEPIECLSTNSRWKLQMRSLIDDYNFGDISHLTLIVTHQSNADLNGFLTQLARIKRQEDILFIADEVHYLGSKVLSQSLVESVQMRLGLSATPERWMDAQGTKILTQYFEREVYTFPIEEAIRQKYLTPYQYIPKVVYLTDVEQQEYTRLSRQIASVMNQPGSDIDSLVRRRNQIIHTSEMKQEQFFSDLQQQINIEGKRYVAHTIVYCPEGIHREILKGISTYGLYVQEIIGETKVPNRLRYLREFANKEIQLLVAMKCLDEGVNIPATRTAYFLANTSNPRQFIQRRGRVLRLAKGKERAMIYDYLVFPSDQRDLESNKLLIKKELARFMEFQFCAENAQQCLDYIRPFLQSFDLTHLLYLNREEIYSILGGQYDY